MFRDPKTRFCRTGSKSPSDITAELHRWSSVARRSNGRTARSSCRGRAAYIRAVSKARYRTGERAFFVGTNTALGEPIPCEQAEAHIFGMVLLNDWSARDIQQWEYVPLGRSIRRASPRQFLRGSWTLDRLEPFRCAQPEQSPERYRNLRHAAVMASIFRLSGSARRWRERGSRSRGPFQVHVLDDGQQLRASHIVGCNVRVGDLMGSGTDQRPTADSCGFAARIDVERPAPLLTLRPAGNGRSSRTGDELILRGWCQGDGYSVGFRFVCRADHARVESA